MDQDTENHDETSPFISSSSVDEPEDPEEPEESVPLLARPGLSSPKPAIILLARTPHNLPKTYPAIISKLQRDAHMITIPTSATFYNPIETLTTLLTNPTITPSIAGIVIADASIMDTENPGMLELTKTLRILIQSLPPRLHHPYRHLPHNTLTPTLIFAFDFPSQATRQPLLFHKYMSTHFDLPWRICGATMGKVSLEIQESGLLKMGRRMYRGQGYSLRAVFLEDVQEEDKVLVVAKSASVRNGGLGRSGQPGVERLQLALREQDAGESVGVFVNGIRGEFEEGNETDSTAGDEREFEVNVSRVEVGEGDDWTVARPRYDSYGQDLNLTGPGHDDIRIGDPETYWDEQDFADDELTATADIESDVAFEFEDEGDKSSSSSDDINSDNSDGYNDEKPTKRVIYINSSSHRRTNTVSPSSSSNELDNTDPQATPTAHSRAQIDSPFFQRQSKPTRLANCPVAIHELRSTTVNHQGKRVRVRAYVGFVGHLEDNRSMASLILGMCAVINTKPLPESVRRDLGVYFG
ncbi:hypothetical protein BJY01DRAFT_252386 [Aspergillus pseudoustus]|uniref:Centromere protein Chl4/mis15/CENP-N n=1 Tax=Aspergillus pseudoustus TaxID=1810923 RepID=A0ABR4J6R3_9EURO